ncbi:MAG: DUF697 domain-containing protein [Candidatus Cloacimonetes bacterium]|nr:DUF697 domain-containing protein [Candidatus Cloacimonadota bacterium]
MKPQKQTLSPEEYQSLKKASPHLVLPVTVPKAVLPPIISQKAPLKLPSILSFIGLSVLLLITLLALLQLSLLEIMTYPLWQTWPKFWFVLIGSLPILFCVRILFMEGQQLLRFRSQEQIREELAHLVLENSWGKALPLCRKLTDHQPGQDEFSASITQAHSDAEVIELMERTVFSIMDQKAISLIRKTARETALFTAISPWPFIDALIMLFRQSHMLSQLCHIYGLRPGKTGFFALYTSMIRDLALSGGSEILSDSISDILGGNLLSKVSAKAGQGVLAALLVARFGIIAVNKIRPLPLKQNPLSLPALLKDIVFSLEEKKVKAES